MATVLYNLFSLMVGTPATPNPPRNYVAEDGVTLYVAEDGVTPYVTEI